MNAISTLLLVVSFLAGSSHVRGGDVPDLLELTLSLDVPNCVAFDDVAVGRAYCTAFAEAAEFEEGTYECLTEQTGCDDPQSRRKLLWESLFRRLQESNGASVVLGGTFGGSMLEEVEDEASAVFANETLFAGVKTRAVEILTDEGASDAADLLESADVRNGTAAAVVVEKECDANEDCIVGVKPICEEQFCVACNSTFITAPAARGDCEDSQLCLPNGSCFEQQMVTGSRTTSSQIELEWECPEGCPDFEFELQCFEGAVSTCQLAASSAGVPQPVPSSTFSGNVTNLNPSTNYTCFVIGNDTRSGARVCSPPTGLITTNCEGLSPLPEQGTCPSNSFCRLVEDQARCVPDQCESDVNCAGDFPICRTESSPRLCMECAEQETPPASGNCPENKFCRASGMCSEDQCASSTECGESLVCVDSTCVECAESAECVTERTRPVCAANNTCVRCEAQSLPPQAGEGNCQPGFFCRADGACAPTQCAIDLDCGSTSVCQNSECILPSPPGEPLLVGTTVNARSVQIFWSDGAEGVPEEQYDIQCLDAGGECDPDLISSYDLFRGEEEGVKGGLTSGENYTCFVIANNKEGFNCSEPIKITTELPTVNRALAVPSNSADFGFAVAVTSDGSLAVVSDPRFDGDRGAVYLYEFVGGAGVPWDLKQSWIGQQTGSRFGHSVSIDEDGTIIVAGAPNGKEVGIVQREAGSDWPSLMEFVTKPSVGRFGTSVSVSGRKAVVGAPSASPSEPGSVFVIEIVSSPATIVDNQLFCPGNSSSCGTAVSMKESQFAVSSPDQGEVFLFELGASEGWALTKTFENPGTNIFGESVALDYSTSVGLQSQFVLLVGAPSRDTSPGIVYFFTQLSGDQWSNGILFQANGSSPRFGQSVALQPLFAATQWAVGDPDFLLVERGAFFVGLLSEGALVSISDPETLDNEANVGRAIALGGSQVVIGSSLNAPVSTLVTSQQVEQEEISTEFLTTALPGRPRNLQPVALTTSVSLSWAVGVEGAPEEYYTVKCVEKWTEDCLAPASGFVVNNVARETAAANVTGLQPGLPYSCFVIANNFATDFCEIQSSINVTTARQPAPPLDLQTLVVGRKFVTFSFAFGAPPGIPAERFFAKCVAENEECFSEAVGSVSVLASGRQTATVEGLPENTELECYVIASNMVAPFDRDLGIGGICSESLTITTLLAPGRPLNPNLRMRTNQSIELEWEDGSEGIPTETFTLRSVLPGGTCSSSSQGLPPALPISRGVGIGSVTGLSPGNTFVSFVIARNNVTESPGVCSQSVTSRTTRFPLAPNSVGILDVFETVIVLTWIDGSTPGVPEERLTVKCGALNGVCEDATDGVGQNVARGAGEASLSGLTPNQEYTCFVSARSNGGPEVCSNGIFVRTAASFCFPATLPAVQGNCETDEFCRSDGECSTQQCESSANCGGITPICSNDNLCTSCTDTTAVGSQGACDGGLFCDDSGACLPARTPDAASGLTLVQRNTSDVTIGWELGAEGFPQETYEVKCVLNEDEAGCLSPGQGTPAVNVSRSQSPNATVTFLSPGVNYLCFVIGNNPGTGEGGVCSNGLSVQTGRPPATPGNLGTASVSDTEVTLEWEDGPAGVPTEQYGVSCQELGSTCRESGTERGISLTGIERGVEEGTVVSLVRNTDYTCYVIAYNRDGEFACSVGVNITTERRECNPSVTPPVQGSCPDGEFCIQGLCFTRQCQTSSDCGGNRPLCINDECSPCSPREVPAVPGNCSPDLLGTFCSGTGACLLPFAAGPPGGLVLLGRTPSSVNVSWTYGTEAFPQETYTLKCVSPGEDCSADDQGLSDSDIPRGTDGVGEGRVIDLAPGTNYDCFVLAVSPAGQNETNVVCSSPLPVQSSQVPSPPEDLTLVSSSITSLEIGWTDGVEPGIPEATFSARCYEGAQPNCQAPNPASEVGGIPRGVQLANVTGLTTFTEYTCYVLALNTAAPDGVCSDSLQTRTDECETDADCDDYDNPFCLDSTPTRCVSCLNNDDCPDSQICDNENKCIE